VAAVGVGVVLVAGPPASPYGADGGALPKRGVPLVKEVVHIAATVPFLASTSSSVELLAEQVDGAEHVVPVAGLLDPGW
jgi:hypothetical protein